MVVENGEGRGRAPRGTTPYRLSAEYLMTLLREVRTHIPGAQIVPVEKMPPGCESHVEGDRVYIAGDLALGPFGMAVRDAIEGLLGMPETLPSPPTLRAIEGGRREYSPGR